MSARLWGTVPARLSVAPAAARTRAVCTTACILRQHPARARPRSPSRTNDTPKEPRRNAQRPNGRPPLTLAPEDLVHEDAEDDKVAEQLDYNVTIGASASKMEDIQPGDFVEVRRTGRTFSGVVLPIPDEHDRSGSGAGASLAVVVISGVLELVRSTDVMLRFPAFVDRQLAADAAPLKRDYVAASTARVSAAPVALPDELAVSHEDMLALRQSASRDNSYMEQEPLDLPRFEKRAWICRKIRQLQRKTDNEIQKIYPAFRALFLQEQTEAHVDFDWTGHEQAPEHAFLRKGLKLLHRGSFTTIEATQLLTQYLAFLRQEKAGVKHRFLGETVFAMHTLFMNHPKQFLVDSTTHRHSQMFTYRSLREQEILSRVSAWVRASMTAQGPGGMEDASVKDDVELMDAVEILDGFCARARAAIRWHEAQAETESDHIQALEQPITAEGDAVQWTATDKDIIEFLKISVGNRRELQEDPTGSVAMSIIKRVGAHIHLKPIVHPAMEQVPLPNSVLSTTVEQPPLSDTSTSVYSAGTDLQHALVFNFLIRLGALTPWEDPNVLDTYLRNIEENANETAVHDAKHRRTIQLNQEEEARRTRFENLPVYVIDSANAHELDDGISVEPAGKDTYWIHVHIADPTARIPRNHPLAVEPRQKYSSTYFPQAQWPLFPDFATYNGMSLKGNSSETGPEQQVLTFSALVTDQGEIRDFDVRPCAVRNVRTLSYEDVNQFFLTKKGPSNPESALHLESTQRNLRLLAQLASKLNSRRITIGKGVNATNQSSEVTVSPLPLPSLAVTHPDSPAFFTGFPDIQMTLTDPSSPLKPGTFDGLPGGISSENMVSEMMLLAGRVAASFCDEHEIPMPYRCQDAPEADQVAAIEHLKHPITGALPVIELQKRDIFLSPAYFSSQPGKHYGLGIGVNDIANTDPNVLKAGGYVRVTSPLRRYADLLSHYQMKAFMFGKKTLSRGDLVFQFPRFERMESWVKQIERASHRYWVWTYVDRLLAKAKQYGPPETAKAGLFSDMDKHILGTIPAFVGVPDVRFTYDTLQARIRVNLQTLGGFPVDCIWDPQTPAPPRGEILQVRIQETVSAGTKRSIICELA